MKLLRPIIGRLLCLHLLQLKSRVNSIFFIDDILVLVVYRLLRQFRDAADFPFAWILFGHGFRGLSLGNLSIYFACLASIGISTVIILIFIFNEIIISLIHLDVQRELLAHAAFVANLFWAQFFFAAEFDA